MNYRHAFHAGNFADVFKHVLLSRILVHLALKPTPFRVIDTHAGIGVYDLAGEEAQRTGEHRDGIDRLLATDIPPPSRALFEPYLREIAALRAERGPAAYPGSPELARRMLRSGDRLIAVEKHPEDVETLAASMGRDRLVKVLHLDGWTALRANVPPPERRGLVLVDPPFEEPGELGRIVTEVARAWAKWQTGILAAWYPIKNPAQTEAFAEAFAGSGVRKVLRIEMTVGGDRDPNRLQGCGLIVVNPPWTLEGEARAILGFLAPLLATGPGAGWRVDWLVPEKPLTQN